MRNRLDDIFLLSEVFFAFLLSSFLSFFLLSSHLFLLTCIWSLNRQRHQPSGCQVSVERKLQFSEKASLLYLFCSSGARFQLIFLLQSSSTNCFENVVGLLSATLFSGAVKIALNWHQFVNLTNVDTNCDPRRPISYNYGPAQDGEKKKIVRIKHPLANKLQR